MTVQIDFKISLLNVFQNASVFFLHYFSLGDIHETAQRGAFTLEHNGGDGFQNVAQLTILAGKSIFIRFEAFFLEAFDRLLPDFFPVIRMNVFERIIAQQFLIRVAGELLIQLADINKAGVLNDVDPHTGAGDNIFRERRQIVVDCRRCRGLKVIGFYFIGHSC